MDYFRFQKKLDYTQKSGTRLLILKNKIQYHLFLFYVISWSILFLGCDSGWIPWERLFSRYTFCSDWLVIHIFFPSKQPKSLQVTLSGLHININYCINMYLDQRKNIYALRIKFLWRNISRHTPRSRTARYSHRNPPSLSKTSFVVSLMWILFSSPILPTTRVM